MDPVATTFERLLADSRQGAGAHWTLAEQAVWDVVHVRCQIDAGGIASVFTDCAAVDLTRLVRSLEALGEERLAAAWLLGVRHGGRGTGWLEPSWKDAKYPVSCRSSPGLSPRR